MILESFSICSDSGRFLLWMHSIRTVSYTHLDVYKRQVQTEEGKYSFEDTYAQGGVSMLCYYMDTGDSAFEMLTQQVVESETLNINGREGIYLGQQALGDGLAFNQQQMCIRDRRRGMEQ